jgi:hypothetical protein
MSYPSCPDPAHRGSRVVRNGWYGKPPNRRQRWRCVPADGSPPHRFTEPLPRLAAGASHCSECSSALDPWEGQAGARTYLDSAREIAHGLASVARGDSYRRAAAGVRQLDRKAGTRWRRARGRRRGQINGQLVANWVDVFAEVVLDAYRPTAWPAFLAVDSTSFATGAGRRLNLLVAYGYEAAGGPGRLWLVRPSANRRAVDWYEFFADLPGTPERIVSDYDSAISQAVRGAFPRGSDPAPLHYYCELHIKQNIEKKLGPLARPHPAWDALPLALTTPARWAVFEQAAWSAINTGVRLPTMANWLAANSGWVARQVAGRPKRGPYAVGALEAAIKQLRLELFDRARRLGNRRRTELMLELLACGLRYEVDEPSWAAKVRRFLEANDGTAPAQRAHDDRLGNPSLYL